MSCTEKTVFAPGISLELDEELQSLMKQSGLAAPDLLQCMVTLYKQNIMHEPRQLRPCSKWRLW